MIRVAAQALAADAASYLDLVERGQEVWIERNGQVIARLVADGLPASEVRSSAESLVAAKALDVQDPGVADLVRHGAADDPVVRLLRAREGASLDGLSWKELRDEGRR